MTIEEFLASLQGVSKNARAEICRCALIMNGVLLRRGLSRPDIEAYEELRQKRGTKCTIGVIEALREFYGQ